MSKGRARKGFFKKPGDQWGQRSGDYMGADSPNWRVESAVPPSMPPPLPAPHQECVDFLYRGWNDFKLEKNAPGSQVKVYCPESTVSPRCPPLDLAKWIQTHTSTSSA